MSISTDEISTAPSLSDLPLELMLNICKKLDFKSMLNLAKTNTENRAIVEMAFKDQYSKNIFAIEKSNKNLDFTTLMEVLQNFGHLITKLKVNYGGLMQSEKITEQINKHLSNSLIYIELDFCFGFDLMGLKGPFSKIESIHLGYGNIHSNNVNFQTIFPAVRSINLGTMESLYFSTMEHHFPHLFHITLEHWIGGSDRQGINILRSRLALNSQLRHVSFSKCSWMALKIVNETLQNVERIDAFDFDEEEYNGDDIYLTNLKVFTIKVNNQQDHSRIPLVFDNLEEISTDRSTDKWFDIIIQNKKLRKITSDEFNDDQLRRIANELTHLEEFTMKFQARNASITNVVEFIKTAKNLKRAKFLNDNVEIQNEILQELGPDWIIVMEKGNSIFVRKWFSRIDKKSE